MPLTLLGRSTFRVTGLLFIMLVLQAVGLIQGVQAEIVSASTMGSVDFQVLVEQHPDTTANKAIIQEAVASAKMDFDAKTQAMSDQDKQAYYQQLVQNLQTQEQELAKGVEDKVRAAVKEIATAKGLEVVMDKNATIYGGQDITADVLQAIQAK